MVMANSFTCQKLHLHIPIPVDQAHTHACMIQSTNAIKAKTRPTKPNQVNDDDETPHD